MARSFRWYDKKRGHRRTGSTTLGRAGELAFFAFLCLLGGVGMVVVFKLLIVPQWRVNREFREHTCIVLDTHVREKEQDEGTVYRPEIKIEYRIQTAENQDDNYVAWTYNIATALDSDAQNAYSFLPGKEEAAAIADRFHKQQQYPCWYDPADPKIVVLERGYAWWLWLVFLVPASFLLIGGGGLVYAVLHWGKSAEHSAAIAQRARHRDLFGGNGRGERMFPHIPDGADITSSPGTRLQFRLPIGTSPGWALFGTMLACTVWNGIVVVFAAVAVSGHLDGRPDWFLTMFLIPFLAVGVFLLVLFVRQILIATGIGPTLVEISDHPLLPGGQYRLFLSQSGRLKMSSLAVGLICEESATYRQGTDARTETRSVFRQELFRREGFEIRHGVPFETECAFAVPDPVMHSFRANHNEIRWKVVVEGAAAGWPEFRRTFSVIIRPAEESPPHE